MAASSAPATIRGVSRFLPAAFLLVIAAPVSASVVEAMDLPSLTAMSERVVRARIVRSESSWDETGMRIRTRHTLDVTETISGTAERTITLHQWGGVVGDIGQRVVGEAELGEGMEAVFFLEPVEKTTGVFRAVGLSQGVWPVLEDGSVGRTASKLTVRTRGTKGTTLLLADKGAPPRPYDELRMEIRRLARRTR